MRGHVVERSPGVWQVTVEAGRDPLTGARRRHSRTVHGDRDDADRLQAEMILDRGPADLTVATLAQRWLDHIDTRLAPSTARMYRSRAHRHLLPALGRLPIGEIDPDMLHRLYRALADRKELKPSTVAQVHAVARSMFRYAVRCGWLDRSPAAHADPPRQTRTPRPLPAAAAFAQAILTAPRDLAELATVALVTGARIGSLARMRWADVDGDEIRLCGKGDRWYRVTIDPETVALLQARRARAAADALACGVSLDDGYVWAEEPGQAEPIRADTLSARWRRHSGFRFHDLRHLAATELIAAGVNDVEVAARLGHSSPNVTRAVYAHARRAAGQEHAAALRRLIG